MKTELFISCGFALALCLGGCGSDGSDSGGGGASTSGSNSGGSTSQGGTGGMGTGGSATGGSATGGSATGGSATGGSATGGSATGGSTGSGGMASGGNGGGAQGGSGGGPPKLGPVTPSLDKHNFYVNCQPQVPPDPIIGSFNATYDNSKGAAPGSAKVTSSKLTMTQANQKLIWSFPVAPLTSGLVPAGKTTMQSHKKPQKPAGTGQGMGTPCGYCQGQWSLEVQWETDGKPVKAVLGPSKVSCVY